MDLEEAIRRLLGVHWKLIAACLVVGLLVGAAKAELGHSGYQASARVAMPIPAVGSSDSEAYADAARAIVTSPGQVKKALQAIHVDRDARTVAATQVTLTALGTSSVEQLTVTDRDPRIAAALANALADRLVTATAPMAMAGPDRIGAIEKQISALDKQLTTVDQGLAHGSPSDLPQLSALGQSLVAQRATLVQQQSSLLGVKMPSLISAATVPTTPISTHRSLYAGLGALLGTVLGVGLAALAETFSPTVASPRRLADLTGGPWLGRIQLRRGGNLVDAKLPWRLRSALPNGAVRIDVILVGPDSKAVLKPTIEAVRALQVAIEQLPPFVDGNGPCCRPHLLAVTSVERLPVAGEEPAGLLVLAPGIVKRRKVEDIVEWAGLAGEPVLGAVTVTFRTSARRRDTTGGRPADDRHSQAPARPSAANGRGSKEAAAAAKEELRP